jgi:hypothetical protein
MGHSGDWLCAMGHCGRFGYVLWGHCGGLGATLWATATNLVMHYGPLRQTWLCAVSHCGGLGATLLATATNLDSCWPIFNLASIPLLYEYHKATSAALCVFKMWLKLLYVHLKCDGFCSIYHEDWMKNTVKKENWFNAQFECI